FACLLLMCTFVMQWNVRLAHFPIAVIIFDSLATYHHPHSFPTRRSSDLTSGFHTVTITVSGAKNAASTDPYIVFDNFIVATSATPTEHTTELNPPCNPAARRTVDTNTGTGFDTSGATSVRFGASADTAVG